MPGAAVVRIEGDRSAGQLPDYVGTAPGEPVGVGEDDQSASVGRLLLDDAFIERTSNLGQVQP
jgi:hypothetical protein